MSIFPTIEHYVRNGTIPEVVCIRKGGGFYVRWGNKELGEMGPTGPTERQAYLSFFRQQLERKGNSGFFESVLMNIIKTLFDGETMLDSAYDALGAASLNTPPISDRLAKKKIVGISSFRRKEAVFEDESVPLAISSPVQGEILGGGIMRDEHVYVRLEQDVRRGQAVYKRGVTLKIHRGVLYNVSTKGEFPLRYIGKEEEVMFSFKIKDHTGWAYIADVASFSVYPFTPRHNAFEELTVGAAEEMACSRCEKLLTDQVPHIKGNVAGKLVESEGKRRWLCVPCWNDVNYFLQDLPEDVRPAFANYEVKVYEENTKKAGDRKALAVVFMKDGETEERYFIVNGVPLYVLNEQGETVDSF